jgi:hypothetical protein
LLVANLEDTAASFRPLGLHCTEVGQLGFPTKCKAIEDSMLVGIDEKVRASEAKSSFQKRIVSTIEILQ